MTPYYEHAGITIYHGDCREILPSIGEVDLILTDPPYGVAYETAWRSRNDPLRVPVRGDETLESFAEAWPLALSKLRDDRHWYVFASPRKLPEAMRICSPKQVLCWDKGDRGTVGDLTCGFGEAWESILYGIKGRRPIRGARPRSVIRQDWSSTMDPCHPTVKPVNLLKRLMLMSMEEGETCLDLFMGSGTMIQAANELGCRAIGIEIEERYCEIAARRLSQSVMDFGNEMAYNRVSQDVKQDTRIQGSLLEEMGSEECSSKAGDLRGVRR